MREGLKKWREGGREIQCGLLEVLMDGVRTTPTRKDTHLARTSLPPPSFIHVSTRTHTLMGVWWWAHTDTSLTKTGLEKRKGAETPDMLAFAPLLTFERPRTALGPRHDVARVCVCR